jgi:hypothetical protein
MMSMFSQLVLSPTQADFEVRFYGEYLEDLRRCLEYIHRKIDTVRRGLAAMDQTPATFGLIATLQFSFRDFDIGPAEHILRTHLRTEVDPTSVQDAFARVAVKVRDKYFVNLSVSNYESRLLQRPIMPGVMQAVALKSWEGNVEDFGVELGIDINNGLESRVQQADAEVTDQGVSAVIALLERVALTAGPQYVESARVAVDELIGEPA